MEREITLVLIKPGAVQRELIGEIITRFERKGIKIVGIKMLQMDERIIHEHYSHLVNKPFFPALKDSMMKTPVVAMALEGYDIIKRVRTLAGETNPREASPGTIRGDFSISIRNNVVHASANKEEALEELQRFFKEGELFRYNRMNVIDYANE